MLTTRSTLHPATRKTPTGGTWWGQCLGSWRRDGGRRGNDVIEDGGVGGVQRETVLENENESRGWQWTYRKTLSTQR